MEDFIKKFNNEHKEEIEEMNRVLSVLNEIKKSQTSKIRYLIQLRFKVND